MYDNGEGVPQDDAEAVRWYRLAAEQGDAEAQFSLAYMYDIGRGVLQDDTQAIRWYRLAADQGNATAESSLGLMYANGRGVPQDDAEAARWSRLAAEQGYATAQYNLGVMYAEGRGVPQDDAEAIRLWRLAADQGLAAAQFNLDLMMQEGRDVPLDRGSRWSAVMLFGIVATLLGALWAKYEEGLPKSTATNIVNILTTFLFPGGYFLILFAPGNSWLFNIVVVLVVHICRSPNPRRNRIRHRWRLVGEASNAALGLGSTFTMISVQD